MQRQQPALLELGLLDDQSVLGAIGQPQRKSFGYPHAGGGEQPEPGGEDQWSDRAGGQPRPGGPQAEDLVATVDVGDPTCEPAAPERVGAGNFVSGVLGVDRDRKPARFTKAVAPLFRRRRLHRPGEDTIRPDDPIALRFGVGHKLRRSSD
jgi:hypothetical protein